MEKFSYPEIENLLDREISGLCSRLASEKDPKTRKRLKREIRKLRKIFSQIKWEQE